MDWNRILNTMIIIFAAINIAIFSYTVVTNDDDYAISHEKKQQLNEILYANGIIVSGEYPDYPPMEAISVTVPNFDRGTILQRIFDGMDYEQIQDMTQERIIYESYRYEDQVLIFYEGNHGGLIDYYGPSPLYKPVEMDVDGVLAISKTFAEDLIGDAVPLELVQIYYDAENNLYEVLYNEYQEEGLMLCNYVSMVVSEAGVVSAKASVYNRHESMGSKKPLFPVDEVMYMWMDSVEMSGALLSRIERIEIGYHIGVDELNKDATIEAVPNYRIIMGDGRIYEIEAYTNTLRQDTFIGAN